MVPPIVIGAHPKRDDSAPLALGVMLSRLTGAPLHVVGTFWFDSTPQRTAPEDYGRALREKVQHAVDEVLGDAGIDAPVDVRVTCGAPAHALQQTASEVGAGLIIVGSTRRGTFGRITTGTTADRVLDGSPCPVVVAPAGFRHAQGFGGTVGVAFVDTPGGRSALAAGAAIARRTGADMIAYTVTDASTHQDDRARAEVAVERAISGCAADLGCEARVLTGGAAALVEESRKLDFLLRGGRAAGSLLRPLAREVPSRLASGVECPLIFVAPGGEQPLLALFGAEAVDGREALLHA